MAVTYDKAYKLLAQQEKISNSKAKELIDVLAPDGNYMFSLDKSLLRLKDVNVNNLKAVLNFVQEYGKY